MTLELVGLNRDTVRFFFNRLREIITEEQDKQSIFDGEIELDESYLAAYAKVDAVGEQQNVVVVGLFETRQ